MTPRFSRLLPVLLVIPLLSGCLSGDAVLDVDDTPEAEEAVDRAAEAPAPEAPADEEVPRLTAAAQEPWYFTADGRLSTDVPEGGGVNVATSPHDFVLGFSVVEFLSEPLLEPVLVHPETVTLVLHFETVGPMVTNGLFDVAVWGGSVRSMPLFGFATHDPVAAPGVHEVTFSMSFGTQRGIVVPAGDQLRFLVAYGFQSPRETDSVRLLVGGEHPSGLTLTTSRYGIDPFAGVASGPDATLTGELVHAMMPTNCDVMDGVTSLRHELVVPAEAAWLALELKATSSTGFTADIDFDLYRGDEKVAGSHTPSDAERIFLGAETLEGLTGETLTLRVSTCGSGRMAYEVAILHATWPTVVE